ncbi:NAD(P)/FAD-dependent oxidoreductase [Rhodococcus sp. NCIMB 12038]|uniref:NAD(P)/FAD-dependent oxidoreductase n=1 Tax=Rhodococcus sp. NCIMB 12038 TaxID=933800 RepID=UPI000B3CE8CD|nr:FAD-dependent oxidoreductase [Rhodococcus sp. NCIMB 12038]OUS79688.1 FAD-dependent oxidoreductase [Rhodococcus sp. NCIMB 12038]
MTAHTTVIVGASIGGVRTAQALRNTGYGGRIVLIGDEPELPYDKPPLSKALLSGDIAAGEIRLLDADGASALDIELVLGSAASDLDPAGSTIALEDGSTIRYDNLVIATGANARPSPWGEPLGVHVVRSLADATALRQHLERGGHLAIIGAGFIGAETAATARKMGLDVTLIDPNPVPMSRVLGANMGQRFIDLHTRNGVDTRFGVGVESISGELGAFRIQLTDRSTLDATVVVVGIGAVPNDEWLASSGLDVDNGVVCDRHSRARGHGNIYAIGDIARFDNARRNELTRLEHWTNAVDQASVVAHNIVHPTDPREHTPIEYVWSDQYDWKIQIVGVAGSRMHTVVDHPTKPDQFAIAYATDHMQLAGLVTVNWPKALIAARRALATGVTFDGFTEQLNRLARPNTLLEAGS